VLVHLVREAASLARAQGIPLTQGAAGLPLEALLERPEREAIETIGKVGQEMRRGAPDHRLSALQDLEAGRPLEVEETFGYAVRKAAELRLSVPLLEAFYHTVAAIDRARRAYA
jgi:ketopantoate reductase